MSVNFEEIRKEFPAAEKVTYLDAGGFALPPLRVIKAMTDSLGIMTQDPSKFDMESLFLAIPEEVRRKTGEMVNASSDEIAFVNRTSGGLSIAANGIKFEKGDNVILGDIEYPANVYPWLLLKEKGVEVKFVKNKEGALSLEDYEKTIDEKTKVISISSVQFVNGFRFNDKELEEIGKICREKNIYFVVDAIQHLGIHKMDVKRYNIDMLASGCYKRLMVPDGLGIFYIDKKIIDKIKLSYVGWMGFKNPTDFIRYDTTLLGDAKRFEISHVAIPSVFGLRESLTLIRDIGIDNIEKWILHLTDCLVDGLKDVGVKFLTPLEKEHRSGIILFDIKGRNQIFGMLKKNNVFVSIRGGPQLANDTSDGYGIRVSPHFYNNEQDIEKLISVLKQAM